MIKQCDRLDSPSRQREGEQLPAPHDALRIARPLIATVVKTSLWMTVFAVSALQLSADVLIDSLERPDVSPWFFYGEGAATGSVAIGPGHTGQGAVLSYNLSGGPGFGAAIRGISRDENITAQALSLWLRSPANITVRLQVMDTTEQIHQYPLYRPLTATDPNAWYQQVVDLTAPESSFGGAGDHVFHNPIIQIRVLALDPPEAGPVDSLSFDELTAIDTLAYTLNPTGTVIPTSPRTGDLPSNLGVAIHFTHDDVALDAAKNAGFKWVRMDLFWSSVEQTPESYVWTNYDELVESLRIRGMKALFILDYGNGLYTEGFPFPPTSPEAIVAFANFAEAAARHFAGKGVRFEIWNEGNESKTYWNPEQYGVAAKEAIAAIHRGDPTAKVSTTGVSGFGFDYIRRFLNQSGGMSADAIAVHPYNVTNPARGLVENYLHLKEVIAPYYSSLPAIWSTEWGFTSSDYAEQGSDGTSPTARRRQALLAARELLSCYAIGVPFYIYYDLRDDETDTPRENNFGLLAKDYSEKPAMTAVKTLTRFTKNRTLRGFLPTVPTNLVAMRFDGSNDKVVALWLSTPNSSLRVTLPRGATAADFLGAPIAIQANSILLKETDGPVYVTVR